MGLDRARRTDPDTAELLNDIAESLTAEKPTQPNRFSFLSLTASNGRNHTIMVAKLIRLEELSNGTKVHTTSGRVTVVETTVEIQALLVAL